jgi:hypothetical protein
MEALGHRARRPLDVVDRLGVRIGVDQVGDALAQDVVRLLQKEEVRPGS